MEAIARKQVTLKPGKKVVTEVTEMGKFWDVVSLGEDYRHNYYNKWAGGKHDYNAGYYKNIVRPKLEKLGLPLEPHGPGKDEL